MPVQATQPLNLSTWQRQALFDMGLDAWYLTPLTHTMTPADYEHDALIDSLVVEVAPPVAAAPKARPLPTSNANAPITASAAAQPATPNRAESGSPTLTADVSPAKASTATPTSRHMLSPPPSISLAAQTVTSAPASARDFVIVPSADNWQTLEQQAQALAASAKQAGALGEGQPHAEHCLIFAPPRQKRHAEEDDAPLLSESATQLLRELFASIGIDWDNCYRTRLLKHATAFGQAPDDELLQAHLPLLASELALLTPKRLWLFGADSARAVLQTDAPLSQLLDRDYQLSYHTTQGRQSADLICLPAPDYLLALPAEKGRVWQHIKRLRQ
ncbi:MAG: hypothetical protein CR974_02980 [Gammaproteobacteria bacterium]|nr:MAG: hypothetical protein CR974_02980 [Gammaproteobacteria bacterium]